MSMSAGNGNALKQQRVRRRHRWLGKTIVAFIVFLALSGIVLNHGDDFGLDRRYVSWSWVLDAYGLDVPEPAASFADGPRRATLLGERLFLDDREVEARVSSLTGMVVTGPLLVIAGESRVHVFLDTGALVETVDLRAELPGVIDRIGVADGRVVIDCDGRLWRADADVAFFEPWTPIGGDVAWSNESAPAGSEFAALQTAYRGRGITVERVLLDLHSGRIFGLVGKLFLDMIAVILIVLSVSGLILARLRARSGNGHR
jgi:hypothetical protein